MASTVKIKRSEVLGNPAVLGAGELAYSALPDNGSNGGDRLYIGTGIETNGNAVNHVTIGGKRYTDLIDSATSTNTVNTLVRRDNIGNFTANTITAQLTGNAATSSRWIISRNLNLTGDATATFSGLDGSSNISAAITLATVNSNTGTFGGTTAIPVITVNSKGLITAVSTTSISGILSISGNTGSDTVTLGTDTLALTGGTGVNTTVTNNHVTIAIGQAVGTTDNVTFNFISHSGLLATEGTNVDQLKVITKSLTLTTDWQDTGIKSTDLATGTYLVQLFANDLGSGGTNNNEYYSGTLSWYSSNTNSAVELPTDEVVLHRAGASGDGALYLRTYRTPTVDPDNLKLQIYSNTANASAANYVFKFRRMI